MGALTIIPASVARNITFTLKQYILASTVGGAAIAAIGAMTAHRFGWLPGPTIVLLGSGLFVASLLFARLVRPMLSS
jgi:ABC-type Mn2+/Zn2+ transport system permease subunit